MTDEQKALLEALNTLLNTEYTDTITFQTDASQVAPIKIIISHKPTLTDEPTFYEKILDKAENIPGLLKKIGMRTAEGQNRKRRVASDNFKMTNLAPYLHKIEMITESTDEVDKFKDKAPKKLTPQQFAQLMEHAMVTWVAGGKLLRQPTKFNDRMFRGYLKLRKSYSHDEIIEGIKVYIRWVEAYTKAKYDDVQFWFYRWSFDKFLVSDTSMSHVDGGWDELVLSKNIPSEYAGNEIKKPKYKGMFQE